MQQDIFALTYFHSLKVVVGDLKPGNNWWKHEIKKIGYLN